MNRFVLNLKKYKLFEDFKNTYKIENIFFLE